MLCRIIAIVVPKTGTGQRQQERRNATSSASNSEHSAQKVSRQIPRRRDGVHCDDDSLGRGEANMETDGQYSTEEVNSYTEIGCLQCELEGTG